MMNGIKDGPLDDPVEDPGEARYVQERLDALRGHLEAAPKSMKCVCTAMWARRCAGTSSRKGNILVSGRGHEREPAATRGSLRLGASHVR
jgi:hypothetical protein